MISLHFPFFSVSIYSRSTVCKPLVSCRLTIYQQLDDRLLGELFFTFTEKENGLFFFSSSPKLLPAPSYSSQAITCTVETNMAAHWDKHLISRFLPKNLGQYCEQATYNCRASYFIVSTSITTEKRA